MNLVEYTEFVIKSICVESELVRVQSFEEEDRTILEVLVPEADMGRVIGKGGNVIKSIRVLIQAYAYLKKLGKIRVNIESF